MQGLIIGFATHFLILAAVIPPFSMITLSQIFFVFYQLETYFITNGNLLTAFLQIFLVLKWSGKNLNVSRFFMIVPILILEFYYNLKQKSKVKGWFYKFIFYGLYFEFYSLNASNISNLTKYLCIHCGLFFQQHFCLHLLFFYAYYYHLPRIKFWFQSNKFFNSETTRFRFHFTNN